MASGSSGLSEALQSQLGGLQSSQQLTQGHLHLTHVAGVKFLKATVCSLHSPSIMNIHSSCDRVRLGLTLLGSVASAALAQGLVAPGAIAGSMITSTTPGTVVTPSVVDIYLEPDDSVTFQVEVDPYNTTSLDVFLLNDVSGSFYDDLPNVSAAVPSLVDGLSNIVSDVQFGLGSFSDKPIFPFGGWTDTNGDGYLDTTVPDYPYQTELGLTNNVNALQGAVDGLDIRWGLDLPESQLEALMQVALRSQTELGFRDDAFKTVVLQTDAPFHHAGDPYRTDINGDPYTYYIRDDFGNLVGRETLNPNNGDTVFDPWEEYPAIAQVREALIGASIVPIFAVTEEVRSHYDNLVAQWGFGEVVILSSNSDNLVSAIEEGVSNALSDVTLVAEGDDFDYVRQIASDATATKEGTDFNVPLGDTAKFDVTVEDRSGDGLTGNDTLRLTALGYGHTTVNVTVPKPSPTPSASPTPPNPTSDPKKVPEPGMGMALLGLGAWGVVKRWRSQRTNR